MPATSSVKTHTRRTYTTIDEGTYLWCSPHGLTLLRDQTGTAPIEPLRRETDPDP